MEKSYDAKVEEIFARYNIGVSRYEDGTVNLFSKTYQTNYRPFVNVPDCELNTIEKETREYEPWEVAHVVSRMTDDKTGYDCIDFKKALMNGVNDIRREIYHDISLRRGDVVACYNKSKNMQFAYLALGNGKDGVVLGKPDKKLTDDNVAFLVNNAKNSNYRLEVMPCMASQGTMYFVENAIGDKQNKFTPEERFKYLFRELSKEFHVDKEGNFLNDIKVSNRTFHVADILKESVVTYKKDVMKKRLSLKPTRENINGGYSDGR